MARRGYTGLTSFVRSVRIPSIVRYNARASMFIYLLLSYRNIQVQPSSCCCRCTSASSSPRSFSSCPLSSCHTGSDHTWHRNTERECYLECRRRLCVLCCVHYAHGALCSLLFTLCSPSFSLSVVLPVGCVCREEWFVPHRACGRRVGHPIAPPPPSR